MIDREYWDYHPEWLDFAMEVWEGQGRVQQIKDDPRIIPFRERATQAFRDRNIQIRYVKTWINVQIPKQGSGYDVGYPHIHYPLNAITLVHYLEPGDEPAPLDIFDGERVIETIYPEKGLTVFMPNDLRHGVRLNQGTTKRVGMIATALR